VLTPLEHLHDVPVRRGHRGDGNLGSPVQVEIAGLGRRDLEAPPQFGHDRPHDRALLLQRMDITEQEVERQGADHHGAPPPYPDGRLGPMIALRGAASRVARTSRSRRRP
jgi:hypothetical protein